MVLVGRGYSEQVSEAHAPRRRIWQEALILAFVLGEVLLAVIANMADPEPSTPLWRFGLVIALGVALLARHRHWRWLLPVILVLNAAGMSISVLVFATYFYATWARSRGHVAAIGILAALSGVSPVPIFTRGDMIGPLSTLAVTVLVVAVTLATGMYTSTHRALMSELRQRAEEAQTGRAAAEEAARRAERTHIAREMHDIVAHKISLVAMHAGALEVNPNLDREQVQASAGLIRETATTALNELREVLGVLRSDADEKAPLAPQPTWDDVRRLVVTSQEAGLSVDLFDFIDDPVPDSLARTAYRVVQEGLTNIHKHALHTKARVALIGEPGTDLVIEVSNVLPKGFTTTLPGARMGLSGIETRVTHAGGTITSGPTDDGRFEVKAVIPWPTTT